MKNSKHPSEQHNTKFNTHKPRPENKNDLDSREGEEQFVKGEYNTHNKKDRKNDKKRRRDNRGPDNGAFFF